MKATVFGSVIIDIVCQLAANSIERVSMQNATTSFLMLEQGRKLDAEKIKTYIGGGGTNVAVSLARQKVETRVVALTGNDANGQHVRECLEDEGVDTRYLTSVSEADTGIGVIVSAHDNNAAIFTHRGANCLLTPALIPADVFLDQDLVFVGPLSNESVQCFPYIVQKARENNAFIAATPGIRQLTGKPDDFMAVAGDIDLLALNKTELMALFPYLAGHAPEPHGVDAYTCTPEMPRLMREPLSVGALRRSFVSILRAILDHGIRYVAVTDGENGAYVAHGDTVHYLRAKPRVMKGSAGAGDAFVSTLSRSICAGVPVPRALALATSNSLSVIAQPDTLSGLLELDDLQPPADILEATDWSLAAVD